MTHPTQIEKLTTGDRFEIFEQLNLHQRYIDNDASLESAKKYMSLYWPEAKMTVHDLRNQTFEGLEGIKQVYDYAHSVFPIAKWQHSLGAFVIEGSGNDATVEWHWVVNWREDKEGVVSTGTYTDKFQKRNGEWKCIERTSDIDANWPATLFQPFIDKEKEFFKAS
ncbi:MAG: nuclear transport factor 2 family protein [Bacteroidetes bacterium]|nr:nuclear transport factor 2 family protein [Fibrella sp.]